MATESVVGYIYKTTNNVNGKIYVGMHRVKDGVFDTQYIGSGKRLKYAISKYGRENFSCEVLEWCSTDEELSEKEMFWINALNSMDNEIGYNMNEGGIGGWKIDVAGENNPMYGVRRYGEDNPNFGNKRTKESKLKQSESIAANGGHHGEKNPMYGRKHNKSTLEKLSQISKGRRSPMKGITGEQHPCYGAHWWCDGANPPIKAKEQPTPYHHLGRK